MENKILIPITPDQLDKVGSARNKEIVLSRGQTMQRIDFENLANEIGLNTNQFDFKTITLAHAKPTKQGFYFPTEKGTYANFGNIEITEADVNSTFTFIVYDLKNFVKSTKTLGIGEAFGVAPLDAEKKVPAENLKFGEIKEGDSNVVNGIDINNMFKKTLFINNANYSQSEQVYLLKKAIVGVRMTQFDGYAVLNTCVLSSNRLSISIVKLDTISENINTNDLKRLGSGNYDFTEVNENEIVTIKLDGNNNNGFFGEIYINLSMLVGNLKTFNSRPDTNYLNAGFKREKIQIIEENESLIIGNSVSGAQFFTRKKFLNRVVKGIVAYDNSFFTDYLVVSNFVKDVSNNRFVLNISRTKNKDEKVLQSNSKIVYVARTKGLQGIEMCDIYLTDNVTRVGSVIIDLNSIPTTIPVVTPAQEMSYNDLGIDNNFITVSYNAIKQQDAKTAYKDYNSVLDAFNSGKEKHIRIGQQTLMYRGRELTSKQEYLPIESKELKGITKIEEKQWKYQNRPMKLREFHNGYYYFQGDYHIVRTKDLESDTASWEMMASTSSLGVNVYPFNSIRIVNDELVISAKQGADFIYFWQNLKTKELREITVDGVTNNHYKAPLNGSMILPFSISVYGNIYVMALYDVGASGTGRGNSQKVFLSTDRGITFKTIFDFDYSGIDKTWLTAKKQKESFHIHGATYDPFWSRIWLLTGDGATYLDNTAIFWSDDLGVTWKWRKLTELESPTGSVQIMNLIAFDGCLIGMSDSADVGITRINRNDKENFTIESAVKYLPKELYAWGRNYTWHNGELYMTFGYQAGAVGAGSFLLSTSDGYTFKQVWKDNGVGTESDWSMWATSDGDSLIVNMTNNNANHYVFK